MERDDAGVKRVFIALGAVLATLALLALTLLLGAWAYDYRRLSLHEGRLQRLNDKHPSAAQVTQGLALEGAVLLATPRSVAELEQVLPMGHGARHRQIVAKQRTWVETRVFLVSDMVYVVYFDRDGTMRDFACLADSARGSR
jgi:hypothetical protein